VFTSTIVPTIIDAQHPGAGSALEAWRRRELLSFLVWRDLKVRYKQTVLGVAWAVVHPLALMVVFTLVFSGMLKVNSGSLPYAAFVCAGLVPWTFMSNSATLAMRSLTENVPLITRVAIPREILPLASVLASVFDTLIALALTLVFIAGLVGTLPGSAVLLPAVLALQLLLAVGIALLVAALNVRYRDIRFVMPLLFQLWMYASPIIYPLEEVPPTWRVAYDLNPMVGIVHCYRAALFESVTFEPRLALIALCSSLLLFLVGFSYFRAMEPKLADMI